MVERDKLCNVLLCVCQNTKRCDVCVVKYKSLSRFAFERSYLE